MVVVLYKLYILLLLLLLLCHLNVYEWQSWQPFIQIHNSANEKQQYIGLHSKNTTYCNYSTAALITTLLQLLADLDQI